MGVVYRARDLMLHRVVAVKALPGTSPEQIQRFRLEARTMAAVSHPHLAAIYSVESWRGRPLLVCEILSMGTLADILARGTLPLAQVLSLGVALANALAAIHDAGFVHRDVKPANIGYASPKHPKLMDLGIAQAVFPPFAPRQAFATRNFEGIRIAGTQALAGTPLYLSPEAIAGELPTAAFDLWSLNVLLLEAVTGRHPFRERTTEGTLSVIREATYERVRATLVDVDPRLRTYFEAALSPKVTSRPASARKVARSMKALAGVLCAR
jgi:serine/threonine-protein kinase